MIKGQSVILIEKEKIGVDDFNAPIYQEKEITINNVLYMSASVTELNNSKDLEGYKEVINIAIPKGDNHNWKDTDVIINGIKYHTIGNVQYGIEEMMPLDWHKKVSAYKIG